MSLVYQGKDEQTQLGNLELKFEDNQAYPELTLEQMCIPLFLKKVHMYSSIHHIQESDPL